MWLPFSSPALPAQPLPATMGKQTWQIMSQLFEGPEPRLCSVCFFKLHNPWQEVKGREGSEATVGRWWLDRGGLQNGAQRELGDQCGPGPQSVPPNEYEEFSDFCSWPLDEVEAGSRFGAWFQAGPSH